MAIFSTGKAGQRAFSKISKFIQPQPWQAHRFCRHSVHVCVSLCLDVYNAMSKSILCMFTPHQSPSPLQRGPLLLFPLCHGKDGCRLNVLNVMRLDDTTLLGMGLIRWRRRLNGIGSGLRGLVYILIWTSECLMLFGIRE